MASIISAGTSSGTALNMTADTSGILQIATGATPTTAVEIDGSQVFKFNSGYGSVATAYGCRSWVNFNGTGTIAIRASANVSSITDNGVGDYTINFTNSMPDGNYSSQIYCSESGTRTLTTYISSLSYYASSSFRFLTGYVSSTTGGIAAIDANTVSVAIIR